MQEVVHSMSRGSTLGEIFTQGDGDGVIENVGLYQYFSKWYCGVQY